MLASGLKKTHRDPAGRTGFRRRSWETCPLKIFAGRYRRFSPHTGHSAMIHDEGIFSTGAGMFW
jgi:hypothetical protein